jgi:GAF domain-containing protein
MITRSGSMNVQKQPADATIASLDEAVLRLGKVRRLAEVMDVVRRAARQLTHAQGATFILKDGQKCFYADEDAISPLWKGQRFPMEKCVSGWSMIEHRALFIEDIYTDPRVLWEAYHPTFVKSLAIAPIRRDSPVGAIGIYWAQRHAATKEEMAILEELAHAAGVAMALTVDPA